MRVVIVLAAAALFADVFPRCGGPDVSVQGPGQECGPHGKHWRGDCREPTKCYRLVTAGPICTTTCTGDTDCAPLGVGFRCVATASLYYEDDATKRRVCARSDADGAM